MVTSVLSKVSENTLSFPKTSRLLDGDEFSRVFSRPVVVQDRGFRILARLNDRDFARLGMAVSRKVCRLAVGRNRIKRQVRESFRHHQGELAAGGGIDIVVLPRAVAATICNEELASMLARNWEKLGRKLARHENDKNRDLGPGQAGSR